MGIVILILQISDLFTDHQKPDITYGEDKLQCPHDSEMTIFSRTDIVDVQEYFNFKTTDNVWVDETSWPSIQGHSTVNVGNKSDVKVKSQDFAGNINICKFSLQVNKSK